MRTVGSYEAKTHLARLLAEVARGETITITRHGVPIAKLVPAGGSQPREITQVIDALRDFRRGKTLGEATVGEFIREGRL
ncbi:MAG TPA: type II toxin-antitoxin system prevent-host-death family antitoxin [Chloroflexota bacterium]|nr:type II toxin-antitoxin system prevent-host-death family antitoxin [Chloroflexota bacterium]